MNNDLDDNSYLQGPTAETLAMADELTANDFETLKNQYGEKKLFDKVFRFDANYYSAADELRARRHQLVINFYPTDKDLSLSNKQKNQIVDLLANSPTDANQLLIDLKTVNPDLTINPGIDVNSIIARSQLIKNAFSVLENLMLDNFSYDYLQDTMLFYKIEDQKLAELEIQIKNISEKMADQLEKLAKNDFKTDETIATDAIGILAKLGRTQLFVSEGNEGKNLGQLVEIFGRFDLALTAAKNLKTKISGTNDNLEQSALAEIKLLLKNDIDI